MKVLILDNFDSFTYNLYQLVGELLGERMKGFEVDVVRNNALSVKEIEERRYDRIIISPGPGSPSDPKYFGVCGPVLRMVAKTVPTLGVCLGMQGIAHVYGGKVVPARKPMHGKASLLKHDGRGVFAGLPQNIEAMRYHSLVVTKLPKELEVSATALGGAREIMGLRHRLYPIEGIQFHPESFATEGGKRMLGNFLFKYD
ncbi:MAG: aminodeoxychorismate/anthranilate synthase component II [Patescibacteria group bacterium]